MFLIFQIPLPVFAPLYNLREESCGKGGGRFLVVRCALQVTEVEVAKVEIGKRGRRYVDVIALRSLEIDEVRKEGRCRECPYQKFFHFINQKPAWTKDLHKVTLQPG
jgi:hypothetical protein